MTIDMAKQIDICDILDRLGEKCATRGSNESWYYAPKREENTPSFHVYKNGTRWHDFGNGQGGDIIDLVKYLFTISSTREALLKFDDIYSGVSSRFSFASGEKPSDDDKIALAPYRVDNELLSHAKKDACFMHILPVEHSIEVDENVLYGDKSLVFDQAENLLYIEKALLLLLFNR